MNRSYLPVILFILFAGILTAGCSQPGLPLPPPSATNLPQTTVLATPDCSLVPGPTQMVPDYESVSITVDRNTISEDPTITTTFNGGKGLGMVEAMTVTVIRSDCGRLQQVIAAPSMGTSVTQMGTTKTDRVIVSVVMTSGDQFTVIDGLYPFPGKI